jgi:hypothetical protein
MYNHYSAELVASSFPLGSWSAVGYARFSDSIHPDRTQNHVALN